MKLSVAGLPGGARLRKIQTDLLQWQKLELQEQDSSGRKVERHDA